MVCIAPALESHVLLFLIYQLLLEDTVFEALAFVIVEKVIKVAIKCLPLSPFFFERSAITLISAGFFSALLCSMVKFDLELLKRDQLVWIVLDQTRDFPVRLNLLTYHLWRIFSTKLIATR